MSEDKKNEWNRSFENGDNFLFSPNEEIVRLVSRNIRKRTGPNTFEDFVTDVESKRILDAGCGVGRHTIYAHLLGLDAYGIDLSDVAVKTARMWAEQIQMSSFKNKIIQGDLRRMPWDHDFFHYSISHGVLDSMPYEIARESVSEISRVIMPGGLFFCDLISGDDSNHSENYYGEEIVRSKHEKDTIQNYFNYSRIQELFGLHFDVQECKLVRHTDVISGEFRSRYYLVLSRKKS
jgi:SAM-dependent methyltransferase